MSELENKIGIPGAAVEPSKAEQSASLQESINEHLAAGGTIDKPKPKPVNRRAKRAAEGKTSKRKAAKVLKVSGARKPTLSSWKMLGVKVGQRLVWVESFPKICTKTYAVVKSINTMELEVHYGKKSTTTDGLMRGEVWIRKQKKMPVPSSPQGWFKWGIEDKKGKLQTIHSIWEKLDRETVMNRRGF